MMNSTDSSLTQSELDAFRKAFCIPSSVETRVPTKYQVADSPPAGMIAVYADFFENCGLRFPLTRFFKDILATYRIHFTQLSPNSVRIITRFEKISVACGLEPKVSSFRYFYRLNSTKKDWFTITTRRNIAMTLFPELIGWESRFFFMDVHPFFPENMQRRRCRSGMRVNDPVRKFGEYDGSSVLRLCHVLARFKVPHLENSEQDLSIAKSLTGSSYSDLIGTDAEEDKNLSTANSYSDMMIGADAEEYKSESNVFAETLSKRKKLVLRRSIQAS